MMLWRARGSSAPGRAQVDDRARAYRTDERSTSGRPLRGGRAFSSKNNAWLMMAETVPG